MNWLTYTEERAKLQKIETGHHFFKIGSLKSEIKDSCS